jgi:hypothetical protein
MEIRSNKIGPIAVHTAFAWARKQGQDIWLSDIRQHGARRFTYGITFHAHSNTGKRKRNSGAYGASGYEMAATWDAYGYVIRFLYSLDPDAQIPPYGSEAEFYSITTRMAKIAKGTRREHDHTASFLEVDAP